MEQLKTGSHRAIAYINHLQSHENAKQFKSELSKIAEKFQSAEQDASKSQAEEFPKVIKETAPDNDFEAYYRSIIDIQFSSKNLYKVATEIHDNEEDLSPVRVQKSGQIWFKQLHMTTSWMHFG